MYNFVDNTNCISINSFKGLKFLNLSGCPINNDGIYLLINSLKTSYSPLEYIDITCCHDLSDHIYQTLTTLMSNRTYKFLKNENLLFKDLPLTVHGVPPALICLNDSDDNTDKEKSAWWNYKKDDQRIPRDQKGAEKKNEAK
ncbi:hypothetical protein PMLGA01_140066600 [Plasmodium malariae]|uniref:Leucine-rich repeat protein n=1 Tax=Plasmodium malariae TaxID=5858 RepID=A0A1C3L3M0_PLAMA|nr:hypothetical protein PMLGA01_140066600 [Plasmodium malariae]